MEKRDPCNWGNILNGKYEFTNINEVELVGVFNKSDINRKLYKGFEFLPKLSSIYSINGKKKIIKILY
jgi:hypothetical protein